MSNPHLIGRRLVTVGALAQVGGLGIDVWMHVEDPTLAAREGLLTLSNVGHVLLLSGIALVLLGTCAFLVGRRFVAARPRVRAAALITAAIVLGGATVAAANSSLTQSHDDPGNRAGENHAGGNKASDHGHGAGTQAPYEALDKATRTKQSAELTVARKVALAYPTVADAEEAGYTKVTEYVPLIGAHYMRFVFVDGTFDIRQPEMLLYDGTSANSKVVGLSFYATARTPPEGFAGPNDHWHRHLGLCVANGSPLVVGDEQTTDEECARLGGRKADGSDGWMVHAWVVPGWDSPDGVFSAENSQLL